MTMIVSSTVVPSVAISNARPRVMSEYLRAAISQRAAWTGEETVPNWSPAARLGKEDGAAPIVIERQLVPLPGGYHAV